MFKYVRFIIILRKDVLMQDLNIKKGYASIIKIIFPCGIAFLF